MKKRVYRGFEKGDTVYICGPLLSRNGSTASHGVVTEIKNNEPYPISEEE